MIAEAIALIDYGQLPYCYWSDNTYQYDGGDGDYAAVAFEGDCLVATVFDHDSDRSPFRCEGTYEAERFFRGLPTSHRPLADRCLMCWRQEHEGRSIPLVTAAFWDDGEYLTAAEPWEQVWEHGAHVIRRELIEDLEEALAEWQVNLQLSPEQVAFARSLFQRKMARPNTVIELEPADVQFLIRTAAGETGLDLPASHFLRESAPLLDGVRGETSFEAGLRSLATIGIHMPR
jgi:hypothetical protein